MQHASTTTPRVHSDRSLAARTTVSLVARPVNNPSSFSVAAGLWRRPPRRGPLRRAWRPRPRRARGHGSPDPVPCLRQRGARCPYHQRVLRAPPWHGSSSLPACAQRASCHPRRRSSTAEFHQAHPYLDRALIQPGHPQERSWRRCTPQGLHCDPWPARGARRARHSHGAADRLARPPSAHDCAGPHRGACAGAFVPPCCQLQPWQPWGGENPGTAAAGSGPPAHPPPCQSTGIRPLPPPGIRWRARLRAPRGPLRDPPLLRAPLFQRACHRSRPLLPRSLLRLLSSSPREGPRGGPRGSGPLRGGACALGTQG
mmetsp:Transcript_19112/g.51399  ORF Transcript_19112/g.51399 Transcript_19112/m.51399 type:complete len:314 (-) Transcript_19112:467-1408(-)